MLTAERAVADLLKVADTYIAHTGVASSTLSKRAANDGADLFGRLRADPGAVVLRRVNEVMCVLAWNWPKGLAWPADVPRPTRADIDRLVGRPGAIRPAQDEARP